MKKIISIILFCSLLLICFSGCSVSDLDDVNGTTSGEDGTTTGEDGTTTAEDGTTTGEDGTTTGEVGTTTGEVGTTSNNEINSTPEDKELSEFFEIIRSDAESEEKLKFRVVDEQIYYELKSSGQYDNSRWVASAFHVYVYCVYDKATNEDWYKQCSEKDTASLNDAFYNSCSKDISKCIYTRYISAAGMLLRYYILDDFNYDYAAIKALMDLEYVTQVYIQYHFGLPMEYYME